MSLRVAFSRTIVLNPISCSAAPRSFASFTALRSGAPPYWLLPMRSATRSAAVAESAATIDTAAAASRTSPMAPALMSACKPGELGQVGTLARERAPRLARFLRGAEILEEQRMHDAIGKRFRAGARLRDLRDGFRGQRLELRIAHRSV